MKVNFTFRHMDATDALKDHIEKKCEKFGQYVDYEIDVHVILTLEKASHCAEITLRAEHKPLVGQAKSKDLYESIDMAVTKVESQLKKEREKRKGHKSAHLASRHQSLKLAQDVAADLPHKEKKI
jgi:putative sigma-54 modulation protein